MPRLSSYWRCDAAIENCDTAEKKKRATISEIATSEKPENTCFTTLEQKVKTCSEIWQMSDKTVDMENAFALDLFVFED